MTHTQFSGGRIQVEIDIKDRFVAHLVGTRIAVPRNNDPFTRRLEDHRIPAVIPFLLSEFPP